MTVVLTHKDWTTSPLGELTTLRQGLCFNKKTKHLLTDSGIPVLRIKDLINRTEEQFCKEDQTPERFIAKETDIIYTRTGQVGLVFTGRRGVIHNNCFTVTPDERLSRRFLYWLLQNPQFREEARLLAKGAAQPDLSHSAFNNICISYPNFKIQEQIADILSAYDDLIENNRRRIQLLEEAARLLYREWFVHLRFPGHEHVAVVDGVPVGWGRKRFSEIVDFKEGPGLRNYQYRDEGVPFLNIRTFNDDEIDLSKAKCIDETEVMSRYQHFLLEENDHVVSSSGTLGRLVTVRQCHLPVMLNTSLIRMRPIQPMMTWYLKTYLKYGDFVDQARSMATGAAQLNFGPSHLRAMTVLLPNPRLTTLFDDIVEANYEQIKVLLDVNMHLEKARDLLLPRLMNGEISV